MNLQYERIASLCKQLKLDRVASDWGTLAQHTATTDASLADFLERLLKVELGAREERKRQTLTQLASLPAIKTLEQYDFSFAGGAPRAQIQELGSLAFIERAENVVLLGPPGTGKSHLCVALGVEAVRAGKSVYFGTLAEIVASMAKAEREGNLTQRVRFLARNSLLIVDEIGYLPVGSNGGNLFFQLVNACYERCAIILTSNRTFGEWGEVFGDSVVAAALLERLLHHAIVVQIEGSSYRLREHADLLPDHLRNRSSSLNPVPAEPARWRPGRPRRSSPDQEAG